MSARTFKLVGAAGAAALTVGALAGPAVAAARTPPTSTYSLRTRSDSRPSVTLQRRRCAREA